MRLFGIQVLPIHPKKKKYTAALIQNLKEEGIKTARSLKVFVYDAPYSFINRRNEISISIVWIL